MVNVTSLLTVEETIYR